MKKIITTVMALTLALGMSVTALADPSPSKDGTVSVDATVDGESMEEGTAEAAEAILAQTPVTITPDTTLAGSASDALTARKSEIAEKIKYYAMGTSLSEFKADDLTVLTVYNVTVPQALKELLETDTGAYLWVRIPVAGVTTTSPVGALHQKADGTWEQIDALCLEDGIVSVASRDFSPIAIIGISSKQTTPAGPNPAGPTDTNQSYNGWAGWDHSALWAAQTGATSPKTGEAGVVGFALVAVACGVALVFTKKKFA